MKEGGCGKFTDKPCTGVRTDKLARHEASVCHGNNAALYREWKARECTGQSVIQVAQKSNELSVDEGAFSDSLRCLYWLVQNEVPHTTLFSSLRDFCILLGNTTLPELDKAKNLNYRSKQVIAEMVKAIGQSLEKQLVCEVAKSHYYSLTLDEATDISVLKQLAVSIQYVDQCGKVQVKFLKIMELSSGTADIITEAIIEYLSKSSLDLSKLAGIATDGASVMVGSQSGVTIRLKAVVPRHGAKYIGTCTYTQVC